MDSVRLHGYLDQVSVPYLTEALSAMPALFRATAGRLETSSVDRPTHVGRFTPREVMAHLSDWEPIFLSRMQLAVSDPGVTVPVYDEGDRATELGYSGWDVSSSLANWASARAETVLWLTSLQPQEWAMEFLHPERGVFSVTRQATMLLAHDVYHLVQLEEAGAA